MKVCIFYVYVTVGMCTVCGTWLKGQAWENKPPLAWDCC